MGETVSAILVCEQNATTGNSTATVQAVYEVLTSSVAVFVVCVVYTVFVQVKHMEYELRVDF